MNIAIVTAGGVGTRCNYDKPKQFVEIDKKPLIAYTLQNLQKSNFIDKIVVVCLSGYENDVLKICTKYNLSKVHKITQGGNSNFESILNGLNAIINECSDNDIILIHDANRPNVSEKIIKNNIDTTEKYGNSITSIPVVEVVYSIDGRIQLLDRNKLLRVQTPICGRFGLMFDLYNRALKDNKKDLQGFCSLLTEYGYDLHFTEGSEDNFKITYKEDMIRFQNQINARKKERK